MADKVGTKTGKKTKAGRDVYKTPEGENVSEKSVTIKFGDNAYVNAPSIHNGVQYNEDEIKQMLLDGKIKPTSRHDTLEEALEAAQARSASLMKEGGMARQMDLFEEGGLLDEGGQVDEMSGNEVPTGSLKEEVRDDIPAQLSEGEFVLPADVVRYHGLDKIMALRDEAKAGLARMEAMGQMGNAEEATIPDGIPFDIEDLELDMMDEGPMEMQVGGYVPPQPYQQAYGTYQAPTGMGSVPSQFASYSQQIQPASQFQPFGGGQPQQGQAGYVPTFYQTPTGTQQGQQYTFQQMMPTVGGTSETREYRNEAGQSLYIPFVNGQPVYPVPEGYTEYKPEAEAPTQEETTAPTTVTQDSGGDNDGFSGTKVGGVTGQQLESTRSNLGVTGSRGINLGALATGIGFVMNPVGAMLGLAAKEALNVEDQFSLGKLGAKDPSASLTPEQQAARTKAEALTGQAFTGYVGNEIGDIDPVTGGQFGPNGVAIDTNTGFAAVTKDGQKSFNSIDTAKSFMSASLPGFMGGTGFYGGIPSADMFSSLSPQGKMNNAKYLEQMEQRLNTTFNPNTTIGAIKTFYGTEAVDPVDKAAAFDTLVDAMANHAVEKGMTASNDPSASANQVIGGVMAGVISPQKAMQEQGISTSDFSSSTAAAQAGIGYSSYDENGQPTGAAPKGSGYSKTGTFSSGDKDTSTGAGVSVGFGEGQVDPGLAEAAANKEKSDSEGPSKIVCTEMYRQTQLDDWAKAIKIWDVYQRKYLTPYHEKGYHWLFRPYVQGMKKSSLLTQFGAYLAKQRTQHLRHVLTKGRAKDSIVGNIWCKIIHPIVYVAGRIK